MKQIKSAFTLVELIVVITILAVLATVGFISFTGYTQYARDSARVTDIRTVEKSLVFYQTQNNIFPDPSDFENISINDGGTVNLWKSGVIGKSVITEVRSISQIPEDPNTQEYIKYSTTLNNQEYQLMGYLEDATSQNIITQSHARTDFPKVSGNYNKYFVIGDDNTYYATPSLFTSGSDVTNTSTFDVDKKVIEFEVKKLQNLSLEDITVENIQNNFTDLGKSIQEIYSGSQVEDDYKRIINIDNDSELNEFVQIITGNKKPTSTSNVCNYLEPIKSCTSGWKLNGNNCEQTLTTTVSSECPSGYTDTGNQTCEKVTSTPANASCPSGYSNYGNQCRTHSYQTPQDDCPSGYSYVNNTCMRNKTADVCPAGYTNSPGSCENNFINTSSGGQCQNGSYPYKKPLQSGEYKCFASSGPMFVDQTCRGGYLEGSFDRCYDPNDTTGVTYKCNSGYDYYSSNHRCIRYYYASKTYSCSSGTLNGSVCEQTETIAKPDGSCAEGYTLQSDNLTCEKIETQTPSFSCESGFILNENSNKCEREEFISC